MKEDIDSGEELKLICAFIESVKEDPRINTAHISLYASLISHWNSSGHKIPLRILAVI
ncbi:MAG: hypothetical protein JWP81_606 [Ferruginibacter sp.]|nr:hypothetical protein [Ferruginibacter sp.]